MAESIPAVLLDLVGAEIEPGERLVWLGQPAPGSRAFATVGTFLFGIPFFAFAVFWTWGATHGFNAARHGEDRIGWFGYLWGGMFVLVGASMLLSPVWAWWVARHTVYAITDRRALLIERPLWRSTVQAFTPDRLTGVIRQEDGRGRGDLIFEREASKGHKGRTVYRDVGFFGLEDARTVARLLPVPDTSDPVGRDV